MTEPLRHPDPPLADAVVALRAWRADDVPERLMGFAEPSVQRFSWPHTRAYTEADAQEFFVHQDRTRVRGEELSFAFTAPGDPMTVLGGGSVFGIDPVHARAAVGYWLTPEARGRGVATHATRLMARWAFEVLGVARLELTCGPDNPASQRVALRCGFQREGVLRSHLAFKGGRRDTIVFSRLPGDSDGG